MIEGHADSRGTNEYNLALGERRAQPVRDYIISLGIPAARITIVSKGEEAPTCRDEAESCWPLNRRALLRRDGEVSTCRCRARSVVRV